MTTPVIDLAVAQRIESTLAADVSSFVAGLQRLAPHLGARLVAVGGGVAAYTGPGLFGARVQGAGLTVSTPEAAIAPAERFYRSLRLPTEFELCPLVDRVWPRSLAEGGYRLVGFRNIYVTAIGPESTAPELLRPESSGHGEPALEVRRVGDGDVGRWSKVLLDGFGYTERSARRRVEEWNHMMAGLAEAALYLAQRDGEAIGAASVLVHGTTASLGGTATLPAFRRQGTQRALLRARLEHAASAGCDLAVVTADPGGASARNIERAGFRLAYTNVRLRNLATGHGEPS